MTVKQLSDGNPDGVVVGQSGDALAFFGATPSAKATVTAVATGATAATIVTTLQALQAELASKGLISNS